MTKENSTPEANATSGEKPVKSSGIKTPTIINLVLLAGLVVLYVLYFTGTERVDEPVGEQQEEIIAEKVSDATAAIAYVNSERLMDDYQLAVKMREELEEEQHRLERELTRRQRAFQTDLEEFQRGISAGTLPMDQAQMKEQELMQMQQELYQLSDTYRDRLNRKEMEMNRELMDEITGYLEQYNQRAGYDFILGFARGGGILFAKEKHDITDEVLTGLNEAYEASR